MTLRRAGVVIPARNEEELLPRTLASVAAACTPEAGVTGPVSVAVVVDSSTDGTADAADRAAYELGLELHLLETGAGIVGEARAAGVEALLEAGAQWIGNTDADTVVPRNWLHTQLQFAASGYGLVLGTVVPDASDLTPRHLALWHARHELAEGHPHVHGANLGFSDLAYAAAGGFLPMAEHEDLDLANRMKAAGVAWVATDWNRSVTSGRSQGRAPGGFSGFLRQLPG
ncbi:glycosyltransferase [Arthrobacter sp. 7Tela_A1]|uniref:glycosyltransferase n=1 Tax=Arthrobacter sp. 7Tela_A1 TaxID=3093745 RepID=UPI003BB643F6